MSNLSDNYVKKIINHKHDIIDSQSRQSIQTQLQINNLRDEVKLLTQQVSSLQEELKSATQLILNLQKQVQGDK